MRRGGRDRHPASDPRLWRGPARRQYRPQRGDCLGSQTEKANAMADEIEALAQDRVADLRAQLKARDET